MGRDITISAILPVYNVGPWIGECIESLKRQKQEGLEFIFVDDCGTDDSMKIVEEWAAEDERVSIIRNKENSGSGPSRNAGIEAARGEYLSFIDPDDLISDDFYDLLYNRAKETGCDIVKGKRVSFEDGQTAEGRLSNETKSVLNKRINERLRRREALFISFTYEHTTAIYRRSLFSNEDVRYGRSKNSQDTTFLLKVCLETESITTAEAPTYYYRTRRNSATSMYTKDRLISDMLAIEESLDYLLKRDIPKTLILKGIQPKLKRRFTGYYYASESGGIDAENSAEYIRQVTKIADKIWDKKDLIKGFPELEAYLKYGELLPASPNEMDEKYMRGIEAWTDFFVRHSGRMNRKFCYGYAEAIKKSYTACKNESEDSKLSLTRFYLKNINRIDAKSRFFVLANIAGILSKNMGKRFIHMIIAHN